MKIAKQKGFLLVLVTIIIVIFGLLTAALVAMFIRSSVSSSYLQALGKASALAESGLDLGLSNLSQSTLSNRQTCSGLSGTATLTSGSFSVALATDTANSINPRYASSSLATAVSSGSSPSTISVNDSSVFASHGGRVLIGAEVFEYLSISSGTTLSGVTRARAGTRATSHVVGELVSQFQCTMASTGDSPATNPLSTRQYQAAVQSPTVFAVGTNGTLLDWNNDSAQLTWQALSSGTSVDLYAVSALNYHSAWAVGELANIANIGYFNFARLQGNTWSGLAFSSGVKNGASNLYAVSATSESEAWAVGDVQGNNFVIMRWVRDGANSTGNWCRLTTNAAICTKNYSTSGTSGAQRILYAVGTLDLNGDGFANVGYAGGGQGGTGSGNRGIILYYDGSLWSSISLPASSNRIGQIQGLSIIPNGSSAPKDIFFVGLSSQSTGAGKIMELENGAWNTVLTTTNPMSAVSMVDTNGDGFADFGIAVGNNGTVYSFNAGTWSGPFTITSSNLNGVAVLSPTDIWIVGDNGVRFHSDGTSVVSLTASVTTSQNLLGLTAIFPHDSGLSPWYDLIN